MIGQWFNRQVDPGLVVVLSFQLNGKMRYPPDITPRFTLYPTTA